MGRRRDFIYPDAPKVCPQCSEAFTRSPNLTNQAQWDRRVCCSIPCARQYGRPSLEAIFERQTIPEPNSGCLLWLGAVNNRGYGLLTIDGENVLAHRVSYKKHHGDFDETLDVLHHCDNPPCCEPNHLFLGTHQDNMQDCIRKGRFKFLPGTRHG